MGRRGDGSTLSRVRAVSRAVAVLRSFTSEQPELSLAQIAELSALNPGTARRLLLTLRDEGLVRLNPSTSRFSLSLEIIGLANAVREGQSLKDIVQDNLIELADQTGGTAFLSIRRDDKAICLIRCHGSKAVQVNWWAVGGSMPLNCGAAPRVLFADMPQPDQERVLVQSLGRLTAKSVTDPQALRKELLTVKKRGWAIARDDVAVGLSAVAAPLRADDDVVIAAISLGGLTPHIVRHGKPRHIKELLDCARQLNQSLQNVPRLSLE